MRSFILAAAALAFASAAHATQVGLFDGTAHFTSSNCSSSSWNRNIFYSPPNIGSNGAGTSITLRGAFDVDWPDLFNYTLNSGDIIGTSYVTMVGTRVYRNGAYTWSPAARITSQAPATISATTHKVTLSGDIQSYDNPGCDAHFTATLYSYPLP